MYKEHEEKHPKNWYGETKYIGEKNILASGCKFTIIRISMPPLTSEDREKFVKLLHTKLENARIQIRQIRGDKMRDIKKSFEEKEISEDEKFGFEKALQEITDKFITSIDEIGASKEKEVRG